MSMRRNDCEAKRDAASAAMARYAEGDDAAFGDVYDAVAPRLYEYLLGHVRSRALAEDLVQQTFLQLHRARGSFMPGSELNPWVFAIARRIMIDGFRRRKLEENDLRDRRWMVAEASSDAPDEAVAARRTAARIYEALARLPETQRTAFTLTKQKGLSVAEAAEALGTTITAVKLRTHRAVETLRAVLRDDADRDTEAFRTALGDEEQRPAAGRAITRH
jgi:RNA polymerase sigma-70 factor (ECF subfamily)